jgi:hypothetical protein
MLDISESELFDQIILAKKVVMIIYTHSRIKKKCSY